MTDSLNEKQIEAVETTEGHVRVVAGAGSGKTRVLAHRYAFLVNELGIDPGNILCMTFTNKAAQEMKRRISKLVHRGNVNDFVCTIHGFCVKFLREEIFRIGYPKNFIISDEEDSKMLAKQVMEEFNIGIDKTNVTNLLNSIQKFKSINIDYYIDNIILSNSKISIYGKENAEIMRYIQLQQKNYLLDFNDIIFFTIYIMSHYEDALSSWQQKMNYIMVDEVQDCSGSDWQIINYLEGYYGNLFIVGDPDQCIYEWRGAIPDSFINFKTDADIILNQNYRSTPNILDVANSIIEHNQNRIPKDLFTKSPKEKIVLHYHGKSEIEEAEWVAKQIEIIAKNGFDYNSFAILFRASYISRNIEQALMHKQIKYVIWGGIRFFERREIKDILAYFRLIANKRDDIAFQRIINTPSRKFGKVSLDKLQKMAEAENATLYDTLCKYKKFFDKPSIINFIRIIDEFTEKSKYTRVSDLFDQVFKETGLEEMYRTESDNERLENISELKHSIIEYERMNAEEEDINLNTYLQDIALYTNADYKNDGDTVKLMTIHQSKGLEFPFVFVCGLSEGIFPSHRTIRERRKRGEEEERRLMYVAVTRAEKGLFLTESEGYNSEKNSNKFPSRFLHEIKDGLVEIKGDLTKEQLNTLFDGTQNLIDELEFEINPPIYNVGDKVVHKYFGIGEIIEIVSDTSIKIRFKNGERFIHPRVLTLLNDNESIKNANNIYNKKDSNIVENKRIINTNILAVYPDYDIVVIKGRFGPFIQHAGNNYKLPKNIEKQQISLEYCLEVIKESASK